jgi:hypothetical protein
MIEFRCRQTGRFQAKEKAPPSQRCRKMYTKAINGPNRPDAAIILPHVCL